MVATAPPPAQPPGRTTNRGWLVRISLLVIGASLIVGLVLLPRVIDAIQKTRVERPPPQPAAGEVVDIIDLRPADGGPPKWIDAARSTGVRNGLHVKITRCAFGPVAGRDANGELITAGPGDFLQIYLRITNRQKIKARYISWYGNQFRDGDQAIAAKLMDDEGRDYIAHNFAGLRGVESHVGDVTLDPGQSTGDVLIFALPPAKGKGEALLRLQLPAAAVARTGSFDFKLTSELWER